MGRAEYSISTGSPDRRPGFGRVGTVCADLPCQGKSEGGKEVGQALGLSGLKCQAVSLTYMRNVVPGEIAGAEACRERTHPADVPRDGAAPPPAVRATRASASMSPGHSASTSRHSASSSWWSPRSAAGAAGLRRVRCPWIPMLTLANVSARLRPLGRPPAGLGFRRLAPLRVSYRLAEPQLRVVGVQCQALGANCQCRRRLAEHLAGTGDQREELAGDRDAERRAFHAAAEVAQRPAPVLPLDADGARVEQDERVIGPCRQPGPAGGRDRRDGRPGETAAARSDRSGGNG